MYAKEEFSMCHMLKNISSVPYNGSVSPMKRLKTNLKHYSYVNIYIYTCVVPSIIFYMEVKLLDPV